jgi:hypothetical protein
MTQEGEFAFFTAEILLAAQDSLGLAEKYLPGLLFALAICLNIQANLSTDLN